MDIEKSNDGEARGVRLGVTDSGSDLKFLALDWLVLKYPSAAVS